MPKKKKNPLNPGDLTGNKDQWAGIDFTQQGGLLLPKGCEPTPGDDWITAGECFEYDLHSLTTYAKPPSFQPSKAGILNTAHKFKEMMSSMGQFLYRDQQQEIEQDVLRAHNKSRMQYAWSETLQAHVQIGEPL